MNDMTREAQQAGRSDTARKVVLVGWAAKGVVYVTLAYLVLQMAFGTSPQQATTTGALQYIANTAPGVIALIVLGLGLLAFAVGRVLEVTTLAGPSIETKDKASGFLVAFLYTSLAISAFTIVGVLGAGSNAEQGGGQGGGGTSQQQGSAFLLDLPGGQVIVGIVGVVIIGFGLYEAYKGIKHAFLPTLRTGEMSSGMRDATNWLGTAAYVTKGLILALVGYFFLQSSLTYNPREAQGLDGALREIAAQSWGTAVLTAVAIGLLAYGGFCFIESRYRRIGSSASGTA